MNHITYINRVVSHTWMSHVAQVPWLISILGESYSCHTHNHTWIYIIYVNDWKESCHMCERVMSHRIHDSSLSLARDIHVTYTIIHEIISQIWMTERSRATHMNESCRCGSVTSNHIKNMNMGWLLLVCSWKL